LRSKRECPGVHRPSAKDTCYKWGILKRERYNKTVATIFGDDGFDEYGSNWKIWSYDTSISQYKEAAINSTLKEPLNKSD